MNPPRAAMATLACPPITPGKITPPTLRLTAAMNLLPVSVNHDRHCLWAGRKRRPTTRVFLRAGIALKKSCHHPGQRTPAT